MTEFLQGSCTLVLVANPGEPTAKGIANEQSGNGKLKFLKGHPRQELNLRVSSLHIPEPARKEILKLTYALELAKLNS